MHASVMAWVGHQVASLNLRGRVLEVGSLDVNGSVRSLFNRRATEYVGVDMRPGPGVDIVARAAALPFDDALFDVVVTTETLEHDATFWLTMAEIGRVLKPGGYLILTTRGNGFGEHHEPDDFWRFMPSSRRRLVLLANCVMIDEALDPEVPGIFVVGRRNGG